VVNDPETQKHNSTEVIQRLRRRAAELETKHEQWERVEYELEIKTFELNIRIKELNSLFAISKFVETLDLSLPEIIKGLAV
jgi:hypothetical protein